MKNNRLVFVLCLILAGLNASAATLIYPGADPDVGAEDIAQLVIPTSDVFNIGGTGITSSNQNDATTYVANDRTTLGQTFTTGSAPEGYTLEGVWVRHVGYTTYLDNGTWASLTDGSQITLRICSVAGTTLTVLRSEAATVAVGSGISGGGTWNGTGRWLYIDLDTPVTLNANTAYAYDLTSYDKYIELAGLEAGPYAGGEAYTTATDESLNMGTVHTNGDRTFVADMSPAGYQPPTGGNYQITIEAITDRIIHVHCVPDGQTPKASLIVPDITRDPVSVTINDGVDTYTLTTSQIEARLDKSTNQVSFYTSGGQPILAESGRSIVPYTHTEGVTGSVDWQLNQTTQSWAANEAEGYYGLGQKPGSPINHQGRSVTLEQGNTDAMTPFIVSSGGYGLLWDINCTGVFNATNAAGQISFSADAAFGLDYYFIYGPDYESVIHEYRVLTGTAPMYPKWAFGFWQCKCQYNTQAEVLNIANTFRNYGFPIDLIIQDWKYWPSDNNYRDYWSGMIWDAGRYPDPDAMISQIHGLNMKFMAVVWPFIGPASDLGIELAANGGLTEGGNNYTGQVAKLFDAYDPAIYDIYWNHANQGLFQRGMDAWWMDASEPEDLGNLAGDMGYGPLHSCHNAYALVHTQGLSSRQRQVSDQKRVVMLTRSCWAGQQRTGGATWSGDTGSDWGTFQNQITAGLNYCMAGLPYWTTDIGGYWGSNEKDPAFQELFQRWYQYGAFCPLFRVHGFANREPWQWDGYNGPIYNSLKKYADIRYRLMPYIYTLGSEVTRNHTTIMRGLPMDFPNDVNCQNNGLEFMFGPAFLVRPVIASGAQQADVYLPQTVGWYDFWTGQQQDAGTTITKATPIDVMPLYVNAGSIVPMGPTMEWTTQNPADPIELRIYAGADSSFTLYEDENDNYNYENSAFSLIPFVWNDSEKKLTIGAREGSFPGMLANRTFNIVFVRSGHGVGGTETATPDLSITYNGQAIVVHQPEGVVDMPDFADLAIGWQNWYGMADLVKLAENWLSFDPPAFSSDPIVLPEAPLDEIYTGSIAAYVDYSGDASLTFDKMDGPAWLTVAANGDLSGTPSSAEAGLNSFTVQVTDGIHTPDQATLQIPVAYPKELIGHWTLDETTGTTANDVSGKNMNGTLSNGLTFDSDSVSGQVGMALDFDGTDDYIDLPDGFSDFHGGCTVSVWVYPTAVKNWERFIDFGNGSASSNIWFGRQGTTNNLAFECWSGSVSNGLVSAAEAISLNTWQMFTVTVDSSGNVRLFKNGALVQTGTSVPTSVSRINNYIGRSNWSGDDYYQGHMDDIRIFNYNLSDAEVAALYAGQ